VTPVHQAGGHSRQQVLSISTKSNANYTSLIAAEKITPSIPSTLNQSLCFKKSTAFLKQLLCR
jgi:hypothetical protein